MLDDAASRDCFTVLPFFKKTTGELGLTGGQCTDAEKKKLLFLVDAMPNAYWTLVPAMDGATVDEEDELSVAELEAFLLPLLTRWGAIVDFDVEPSSRTPLWSKGCIFGWSFDIAPAIRSGSLSSTFGGHYNI